MKLGLQLNVGLQQTLTPQQIQYLKLLQLPSLQMEQHIRQEIEQNPMVEEMSDDGSSLSEEIGISAPAAVNEAADLAMEASTHMKQSATPDAMPDIYEMSEAEEKAAARVSANAEPAMVSYEGGEQQDLSYDQDIPDDSDAFEFYKMLWQEDGSGPKGNTESSPVDDDMDYEPFQIKDVKSFEEDLLEQLHFTDINEEEMILGEQIIGNLEDDGYLRRELREVLDDANAIIDDMNHDRQMAALKKVNGSAKKSKSSASAPATSTPADYAAYTDSSLSLLKRISMPQAENVLKQIQSLEPTGCASRTVQECLVAQLRALPKMNAAQKLALEVLTKAYTQFAMKHYPQIAQNLEVTEEYLREAIDVIRRLNPKPGYGSSSQGINTIIPDFTVEPSEDKKDFMITLNDATMPQLRVSKAYEKLKREARYKKFNKDTRDWMRKKHEDAKFLINAIKQRKSTMLKVMTTIVHLQKGFFEEGPSGLRPLIYKDVAEESGMDISTVCRVVNNKYVQTEFGIFELRFFFSESLTNDEGDEVSTTIIKEKIRDIISKESKSKPWSDDKLGKELKKIGYNVARRTVAKYREQLRIPVARLRKEF